MIFFTGLGIIVLCVTISIFALAASKRLATLTKWTNSVSIWMTDPVRLLEIRTNPTQQSHASCPFKGAFTAWFMHVSAEMLTADFHRARR